MNDDPEITDPRDPYQRRDIVAELEAELALYPLNRTAQRARDEIVALREAKLARPSAYDIVRDQALEEAALIASRHGRQVIAAAIRALKGHGP